MTWFYAFGSIIRGEFDRSSDVDLLVVSNDVLDISKRQASIYSPERIGELWREGNPFAWHLYLESVLLYSKEDGDFLRSLGKPADYQNYDIDKQKFLLIYKKALSELSVGTPSIVYELSCLYLALRNISTCFSLLSEKGAVFSRYSPQIVFGQKLPIDSLALETAMRCRILSTRGFGMVPEFADMKRSQLEFSTALPWLQEV